MNKLSMMRPGLILAVCMLISPILVWSTASPAGKGFMGVDYMVITLEAQLKLGLDTSEGVLITKVVPGSPADSCGIRIDDVIMSIDASPITNSQVFRSVLAGHHPGDKSRIKLIRDKASLVVDLVFSSVPALPPGGKLSWSESKAKRISELLDMIDLHNKSMGSIAIADSEHLVFSQALGYRYIDAEIRLLADINTRYRIGSITKTFTAVMIFQLVEAGKLSLDDRLGAWFPAIPHADSITIGMMLTHKSGIFSFTDIPGYLRWSLQSRTHDEIIKRLCSFPSAFQPGEKHEYSNSNYLLLGYIIEVLDSRYYAASLADRIAERIGLKNTYYGGSIDIDNNEAMSYLYMGYWDPGLMMNMDIPGGAGGIVSTATDLLRFFMALFEGELVSRESLNTMLEFEDGFGCGIFLMPLGSHSYYGHTGSIDNFRSILLFNPESGYFLCYLSNGEADPKLGVIALVQAIMADEHINIPQYRKAEQLTDIDKLLGTYRNQEIAMLIEIITEDGEIYAQAEDQPAIRLEAMDARGFECASIGLEIQFAPDSRSFTLQQDGARMIFTKEPALEQ